MRERPGVKRRVERELLDELPADDPLAVRSRGDLQRVNAWMGNARTMAGALRSVLGERGQWRLVELGAGDGLFLLAVARRLAPDWPGARVELLDRQSIISLATRKSFERLGWQTELLNANALEWLREPAAQPFDAMVANLFLHHFSEVQLAELLRGVASRTRVFVAVEPRRSLGSLVLSRLVWLIGCNMVTQHDATVSVRAGFRVPELSRLWPGEGNWSVQERAAGWFSHLFIAQRLSPV